jgi:F-type H+-transporting ATPase subunit gamma
VRASRTARQTLVRPPVAIPTRVPFAQILCSRIIEIFKTASPKEPPKRKLFVVVSSDKGLCGGIHSSLSKLVRRSLIGPEANADPASPIVVIGDKAKAQLSRHLTKNFVFTVNQIGKDVPSFADAAGVVDLIAQSGVQYDSVRPP